MRTLLPVALLLLAACTPDADPTPIAWCDGAVTQRWDPLHDTQLGLFPDPVWTRPDASSPTGLRLDVSDAPWLAEMPTHVADLVAPLAEASGFGRLGAIVLRFDGALGPLPTTAAASLVDPTLQLVELTPSGPVRVPYQATVGEDGTQLVVQPLAVLTPGAKHALLLTTGHVAAGGGCVAPSPTLRALLEGRADDRIDAHRAEFDAALDALDLTPADVSAMTVFTTHDDVRAGLVAAAETVSQADYAWEAPPTCAPEGEATHCTGTFVASDFRQDGGGVPDGQARASWSLAVDLWLPAQTGPHALIMYGHGMNGGRGNGRDLVPAYPQDGFAVVATDALFHGSHPTTEGLSVTGAAPFLGLDLTHGTMSLARIRGSFTQTALDRAQVLSLLAQNPDVDGDGTDDLDPARVGYIGVSLGGLLAPGLLLAHPTTDAAVLQVAGGHLSQLFASGGLTSAFEALMEDLIGSRDGVERFLAVIQAAIDGADPAVIADDLVGAHGGEDGPDVLLQCGHFDDVVPPHAGEMLARGLGAPRLLPGAWPVDGLIDGAPRTNPVVAYQQFEEVSDYGVPTPARHDNLPRSPESSGQTQRFLQTWRDTGVAVVTAPDAGLR